MFAGQDLFEIHSRHQAKEIEKRKIMQDKLSSMRDVHPVINPETTTALSPNLSPVDESMKDALGAAPKDDNGANEAEADHKDTHSEHSKSKSDTNKHAGDTTTVRSGNTYDMEGLKPADASKPVGLVHAACCDGCDVRCYLDS
jgi:hypothetical protein